ncbi:UNVERIFIED_CONTAM: hypothetical protein K2H54_058447 [Gekko kuhli]
MEMLSWPVVAEMEVLAQPAAVALVWPMVEARLLGRPALVALAWLLTQRHQQPSLAASPAPPPARPVPWPPPAGPAPPPQFQKVVSIESGIHLSSTRIIATMSEEEEVQHFHNVLLMPIPLGLGLGVEGGIFRQPQEESWGFEWSTFYTTTQESWTLTPGPARGSLYEYQPPHEAEPRTQCKEEKKGWEERLISVE